MMQTDRKNIRYRKVSFQEIPLLVDYRIKFLLELQGEQTREKEIVLRDELTDYFEVSLRDNSFIAWVAEVNSRPVGFGGMVIQKIPGSFNLLNGLKGYILNMYTVPDYRKNGICNALLDKLIQEGRELGVSKIYLHASSDGIDLYRQKGFKGPHLPELEL